MGSAIYVAKGETVNFTPVTPIAKGTVLKFGALVGATILDIPANALGSLYIGGVFWLKREVGEVFTYGARVYFDLGTQEATTNASDEFVGVYLGDDTYDTTFILVLMNENFKLAGAGGGDLLSANNLSDVANVATARANLGIVSLLGFEANFGDGASTLFTIPHGLGTARLIPFVKEVSSGDKVDVAISIDATNVVIDFNGLSTPTNNQYNVALIGF